MAAGVEPPNLRITTMLTDAGQMLLAVDVVVVAVAAEVEVAAVKIVLLTVVTTARPATLLLPVNHQTVGSETRAPPATTWPEMPCAHRVREKELALMAPEIPGRTMAKSVSFARPRWCTGLSRRVLIGPVTFVRCGCGLSTSPRRARIAG